GEARAEQRQRRREHQEEARAEEDAVSPIREEERDDESPGPQQVTIEPLHATGKGECDDGGEERRGRELEEVRLETQEVQVDQLEAAERGVWLAPRRLVKAQRMALAPEDLVRKAERM